MSVKCLIYCSKAKPYLTKDYDLCGDFVGFKTTNDLTNPQSLNGLLETLNGKIVASFDCEKVEEIVYNGWWNCYADNDSIEGNYFDNDLACLNEEELKNYLGDKKGYAIHISNLQVFDEPKELSDYLVFDGDYTDTDNWKTNQYAPQNMKNVYEFCSSNDVISPKRTLKKCVLISIKPEWVAKILNGEKTIEVRKQVVNKLKELI